MPKRSSKKPSDGPSVAVKALADRLQVAAKRAGLSQAALAAILDVLPSTVSDWFAGRYGPRADLMMQLPDVLGVSGHWLLTGHGRLTSPGPLKE